MMKPDWRVDKTINTRTCLRYGLLGLPLAFVAMPLYVHLPHVYAGKEGMSLVTLGLVLLLARLLDAFSDPWLGRFSDRLFAHSSRYVLFYGAGAALALIVGMTLLFFPPWPRRDSPIALLAVLIFTSLAFSLLAISHQSWGARLGGDEGQRARIVAWREGAGLIGVVLASVLPAWLGWDQWIGVFALMLLVGWMAWMRSESPPVSRHATDVHWKQDLIRPWLNKPFINLMIVFMLNGMASAIPATLVLFFIEDRLNAAELKPLFLATYFVCAAASMPLWMRAVIRWGLARTWFIGMLLAITVFAWAGMLSSGDVMAFWVVCVLSGLALGTDLALPGAMLAGIINARGDSGQREGAYFGWWNLASKLNLALAAGLSLPFLAWLGYQPGTTSAPGINALSLTYSLLPCSLKLFAAAGLYAGFIRNSSRQSIKSTRENIH